MKILFFIIALLPLIVLAHPGIGIVKDSKGNIYYTDLRQVWKISNGMKTIVVPDVHTHELYIDKADNLYGEHVFGGSTPAEKFYQYVWVLKPGGDLDTIDKIREAFLQVDYSFARDVYGNEYYTKQFIKRRDTSNIYKRYPDGREVVLAKGNFKGVTWLHPQKDESLLFALHNNVYRVTKEGKVKELVRNIANDTPSFSFSGNNKTVWGIWQDDTNNIYVAVFSDQTVRKINANGVVSTYYKSEGNWAPLHGVFDKNHQLWVLESSDKNEVRITLVETKPNMSHINKHSGIPSYLLLSILLVAFLFLLGIWK